MVLDGFYGCLFQDPITYQASGKQNHKNYCTNNTGTFLLITKTIPLVEVCSPITKKGTSIIEVSLFFAIAQDYKYRGYYILSRTLLIIAGAILHFSSETAHTANLSPFLSETRNKFSFINSSDAFLASLHGILTKNPSL